LTPTAADSFARYSPFFDQRLSTRSIMGIVAFSNHRVARGGVAARSRFVKIRAAGIRNGLIPARDCSRVN
jgi:hypothetical protein